MVRMRHDLQGIARTAVLERKRELTACSAEIVAGEIPAKVVYQDEHLVAFKDINPQAPMHVLIVPRSTWPRSTICPAADDALVGEMVRRAAAIASEQGYAQRGYRTVFNCNAEAGQTVFHIHLHVLGGRPLTWPPG